MISICYQFRSKFKKKPHIWWTEKNPKQSKKQKTKKQKTSKSFTFFFLFKEIIRKSVVLYHWIITALFI